MRSPGIYFVLVPLFAAFLFPGFGHGAETNFFPFVHQPVQITSETASVGLFDIAPEKDILVYIAGRSHSSFGLRKDIYRTAKDPGNPAIPEALTGDIAEEADPAISHDGSLVAYVGFDHDVKGDIYLLETGKNEKARRLTGRETEEGSPRFSGDGNTLYFHQKRPGDKGFHLVYINLSHPEKIHRVFEQETENAPDSAMPSPSRKGDRIAFVSSRKDAKGDIFIFDKTRGSLTQVTKGPFADRFPAWSQDDRYLYFVRKGFDTNQDGIITEDDNDVIFRVCLLDQKTRQIPVPLTLPLYSAIKPVTCSRYLYFVSDMAGIRNVFRLPKEGVIPKMDTLDDQEKMASSIPRDTASWMSLLAWYRVAERFLSLPEEEKKQENKAIFAKAMYEIGMGYKKRRMQDMALSFFEKTPVAGNSPWSGFAAIEALDTGVEIRLQTEKHPGVREKILERGLQDLDAIIAAHPGMERVTARAGIEKARFLYTYSKQAKKHVHAVNILDNVVQEYAGLETEAAMALVLKADIYSSTGVSSRVYPAYLEVLRRYPDAGKWPEIAVERILDLNVNSSGAKTMEEKITLLRTIAKKNMTSYPSLAARAMNRIGDLYYQHDEILPAKSVYKEVLDTFPQQVTSRTRARLSLAEILYRQKRFKEALDLYEAEITHRKPDDRIYQLAREGYIQKAVEAGEYHFRVGEIALARNRFRELVRYDDRVVEAHRGIIKCAAALEEIREVLSHYEELVKNQPENPVYVYSLALCLTYLEDQKSLERAGELLDRAIRMESRIEYFHQTRGYVYEVLETVHSQTGLLEKALSAYKIAFFLNNPEKNSQNRANLLLNMGNINFLLFQYANAFRNYQMRLETGMPFASPETEMLFYRRLGESAFQINALSRTISAYEKANTLISASIDPENAAYAFDRISTFIRDRILTPLKTPGTASRVKEISIAQAKINRKLFDLSKDGVPRPPSKEWNAYKQEAGDLVPEEEKVADMALSLLQDHPIEGLSPAYAATELKNLLHRVKIALSMPDRFTSLSAEMTDRLGLAYQEDRQWEKAKQAFEKVFSMNERMGNLKNLAVNQRQIAYCIYMEAGEKEGEMRKKALFDAEKAFSRALALIEAHGVPDKTPKKEKGALIDIRVSVSLDAAGATSARYGFTKDQEIRLCRAFLSHIRTETGNLELAHQELESILALYPEDAEIREEDRYGVSLLFHRGGHMAFSLEKPMPAFFRFRRSARMSLDLKNPVSSSVNLMNMGASLFKAMETLDPKQMKDHISLLLQMDKEVGALFMEKQGVTGDAPRNRFDNGAGVYLASVCGKILTGSKDYDVSTHVLAMRGIRQAVSHFTHAVNRISPQKGKLPEDVSDRRKLAVYHLNLAHVSAMLQDWKSRENHLENALAALDGTGPNPYAWRAFAGLGRYNEALGALFTLSPFETGCATQEILLGFSGYVEDLIQQEKIEEAFSLAERLSETERVHRLLPLVFQPNEQGRQFFAKLFPMLMEIKRLRNTLESQKGEEADYTRKRLARETGLLDESLGKNKENLPDILRAVTSKDTLERILRYLAASAGLSAGVDEKEQKHRERVFQEEKKALMDREVPAIAKIFVPDTGDLMEVMEYLDEDTTALRFFPADNPGRIILFTITKKSIQAEVLEKQEAYSRINRNTLPMGEDAASLFRGESQQVFLSASHFVRSHQNKHPFKRTLVPIPAGFTHPGYDVPETPVSSPRSPFAALEEASSAHLLYFREPLSRVRTVPVREFEHSEPKLVLLTEKEGRTSLFPMYKKLDTGPALSLVLLEKAVQEDLYFVAHLFSLFGAATVIAPEAFSPAGGFAKAFLDAYAAMPAEEAVSGAENKDWMVIGYRGMGRKEVRAFAKTHFTAYIKDARNAYQDKKFGRAQVLFENAIRIAEETSAYAKYLPLLYKFGRESAYQAGNLAGAKEYAQKLLTLMKKEKEGTQDHAEASLRLGLILAKMEKNRLSVPLLESAVRIYASLDQTENQVMALSDLGVVLENATDYDKALVNFETAADMSRELNQKALVAAQVMNIARINDLRMNRYAVAIRKYREAGRLYAEIGDREKNAQALVDMGRCYRLLGDFTEAETLYKEAETLVDKKVNPRRYALIRMEEANNRWYRGRYEDAFRIQREVLHLAKEMQYPLVRTLALNTGGLIFWSLGEYARAESQLVQALESARELTNREDEVATSLNNLAMVKRDSGNPEEAEKLLNQALEIDTRIGSKWAIAYDYRNLGTTLMKTGRVEEAIENFEKAAGIAGSIGNRINQAKSLAALGDALFAAGNIPRAETIFQEALHIADEIYLPEVRWRALFGLGRVALANGQREKAVSRLMDSISVIEEMRAELRIEQLKDSFIVNKLEVYATLVKLLTDLGKIEKAFETAERSRARNFLDLLGNRHINMARAGELALYTKQQKVKTRLMEMKQLAARAESPSERAAYEEDVNRLSLEYQNILLDIQAKDPALSSFVTVDPIEIQKIRSLLDPGVVLLSYYVLDDEILIFCINQEDITAFRSRFGKNTLEEKIMDYRRRMQNLEPLEELSRNLYRILFSPLEEKLGNAKIVGIIPHGRLHYLPFAALLGEKGHLIERFPLFYLPAASVLAHTAQRRSNEKNLQVLAVGNPDLGDPALDLPFSQHEAESVKWNYPGVTLLTRERARETWIKENISRFGIIYMASHGVYDPINPLFSAIKLAKDRKSDGNLETEEVFGLDIRADMVVLSACQTGLGRVSKGDEVTGLSRAFFFAGAHAVVASLWRVSDVSTAILIKHFFRNYKTRSKVISLQKAALHVKSRYPHPGYWAAFTLSGDYQ